MENYFNNKYLVQVLNKWKLHLLVMAMVAIGAAAVFSGPDFIKPKYQSHGIIYPSNMTSYSSETPTEQMLQIFESIDIKQGIIERFDLIGHYGVDSNEKYFMTILLHEFDENISVSKTEYESVEIEVIDTDPVLARDIVIGMIDAFNLKVRSMHREKMAEHVMAITHQMRIKKAQIDSIERRLDFLRKEYNLLDYTLQVREATRQLVRSAGSPNAESAEKLLKNIESQGGEFLLLGGYLSSATAAYNDMKVKYEQAYSDMIKDITYTNVVSSPIVPQKKSYPIRWLIVTGALLGALIFSFIAILVLESYKLSIKENDNA